MGLFGFMDGETPQQGVEDLPADDVQLVKDTLAKMLAGEFARFDVFAGPINDNTGKEILAGGPEARAVRPRPVPARCPRLRVHDLHVLVGRRHHRQAARTLSQ